MESNPLATRTYTALTCRLIVSIATKSRAGLGLRSQRSDLEQQPPVDFTLHLDHPDRGESERITIYGQFHQLDRLQQVVSKYITELVAKFPVPNMQNHSSSDTRSTSAVDPATAIDSKLDSNDSQANQSGLMNNLPGLRKSTSQFKVANDPEPQSTPGSDSGISRLFGGWNKQPSRKKNQTKPQHTPLGAAASVTVGQQQVDLAAPAQPDQSPTAPYLTGSERSLDRQLHLGDLANTASGDTVVLSPLQLFDLSNVLDEYAVAETATNTPTESVTFSRANIPANPDLDTATASLSRLPNLPKTGGGVPASPSSQVYNRTRTSRRSRSSVSLMSVVPWAAAAAVAVGLPLAIFSPKPNPIKEAANNVKMPNMAGVKKTVVAAMSPPIVDPEPTTSNSNPATNPNLPKPWATQPVNPPITGTSPLPSNTGTQPIQTNSKPGLAPLPSSLDRQPGQNLTADANRSGITNILPRNGARSGIAPNPLSATIPTAANNIGVPSSSPDPINARPNSATVPSKATGLKRSQLSPTIDPRTVSVSTQPILLPSDLPGIGIAPPTATQMPGKSAQTDPVVTKPPTSPKVKRKVKPLVAAKAAKPQAAQPAAAAVFGQPLFEQSTPTNPTVIKPVQTPFTGGTDAQNPPTATVQPVPANTSENFPGEATDNPSLQQTKRYFQSKWKASSTQANPLQYVVQINGKSGLVSGVAPQGEAATTYLNQTDLIKTGQKLATPAPGATDQKIRVILQPDGNVDTFVEP